jgi:hypothetical protein
MSRTYIQTATCGHEAVLRILLEKRYSYAFALPASFEYQIQACLTLCRLVVIFSELDKSVTILKFNLLISNCKASWLDAD